MKKVISINVEGISFTLEENAYENLNKYLEKFEKTISNKDEAKEIMEDIEARIAEIFREKIKYDYQVVDEKLVNKVISQMGEPETTTPNAKQETDYNTKAIKRLYRNPEDKKISGLCGGFGAYFGIDSTIIRIIILIGVIFGGLSIWIYVVLWIVVPNANTIAEKLEMRGEPVSSENIRNYVTKYKKCYFL